MKAFSFVSMKQTIFIFFVLKLCPLTNHPFLLIKTLIVTIRCLPAIPIICFLRSFSIQARAR